MKLIQWINCILYWAMMLMLISCSEMPPSHLSLGEVFPDGKPVGQPFSQGCLDIRMVKVTSVQEADSFYAAMRTHYSECEVTYTHDVPADTYEVGVIYFRDSVTIQRGVKEIHFVETMKLNVE